jgi:hypothetical protein
MANLFHFPSTVFSAIAPSCSAAPGVTLISVIVAFEQTQLPYRDNFP